MTVVFSVLGTSGPESAPAVAAGMPWHQSRVARAGGRDYLPRLDALAAERRSVPRGAALYREGDRQLALYQVHAGQFKSRLSDRGGRHQVIGFQLSGELLGLDGLGSGCHVLDAVALEDSVVCIIPYEGLMHLMKEFAELQHEFHKALSREIVREQAMQLMLGTLHAEGRIAFFVLDLARRLHERGYAAATLVLRMTRDEIGSYLGLTLETVSRIFSKLQGEGVLRVNHKELQVLDAPALQRAVRGLH